MPFKKGQKGVPGAGTHPNSKANLKRGGVSRGKPQPPYILSDMRAVYQGVIFENPTVGQKAFQKLLEDNPKEFLQRLSRAEELWKAGKNVGYSGGDPPTLADEKDEGEERVLDLIDKLLSEWEGKP